MDPRRLPDPDGDRRPRTGAPVFRRELRMLGIGLALLLAAGAVEVAQRHVPSRAPRPAGILAEPPVLPSVLPATQAEPAVPAVQEPARPPARAVRQPELPAPDSCGAPAPTADAAAPDGVRCHAAAEDRPGLEADASTR